MHIQQVEVPTETGAKQIIPKDSLFYSADEDTSLVMYALKMAPREERTIDVIVIGDRPALAKANVFLDPVSITAAAVITWAAWKVGTKVVCKAINYVGDKARASIAMSPEEQKRYDDAVKGGIPTELEKEPGKIKMFAIKKIGTTITKKLIALTPAGSSALDISIAVTQNVKKVAPSLRQRVFNWFYKETGLYGVEETESGNAYQPAVSGVTQKNGKLVASLDPNEMVGPAGYGDSGYIAAVGKMTYQILFENKKTATAAAYKIIIIDTLPDEFDAATFAFGPTSHESPAYTWKMTRSGSIATWEILGIELPPNVTPPEGEGWVQFTVSPKSNLVSGTSLTNRATIVFDANSPIATNTYINKLDLLPPTSTMQSVRYDRAAQTATVKWKSSDAVAGSGTDVATLFASKNGGDFTSVGTSSSDSLSFPCAVGKYQFYALALDHVGNAEAVRPALLSGEIVAVFGHNLQASSPTFQLFQNHPNPFRTATAIRYALPQKSRVTIEVVNLAGKTVKKIVYKTKQSGYHSVNFAAEGLSSGQYFYTIKAKSLTDAARFTSVKKMVLVP